MRRIVKTLIILITAVALFGCAGMSQTQQRALSGGAIGAGAGAAMGAITGGSATTGAIVGGPAGVVGGYLLEKYGR